ncbi:hypothetical protein HDU91_004265, partial [Kappamyces sp. JEL0680]
MNAWIGRMRRSHPPGHSSLQVIDNLDVANFTQKLDRLVQAVSTRLGLIHDTQRYGKSVKKHKFLVSNYDPSMVFPVDSREFH